MIKVSVLYPNEPGKKFDASYFMDKHRPMVGGLLESEGLVRAELDKGVSGSDPNSPAPYLYIGHLVFESIDAVHNAFKKHGHAIMGDVPNYTDITPQVQISEILG